MQKIMESNEVINDLKNHSCALALKWCSINKSKLAKVKSKLELKLVVQQFIELIKNNQTNAAIAYIKSKSDVTEGNIEDIKKAFGCLVCYPMREKFPEYEYYLDNQRWKDLIAMFKKENYKIFSLTSSSQFNVSMQVKRVYICFK